MSSSNNFIKDDSVVSGVALVLEGVMKLFNNFLPDVPMIYDEALGFDTGARLLRDNNNLRDGFSNKIPAIFFRRSVLRAQEEGIGRRLAISVASERQASGTKANTYKTVLAKFDLEFNFVTSTMSNFENFEISWLTESAITDEKEIIVDIPGLGEFSYYLRYNGLDDKVINSQGNYYKALVSSMTVRGPYFVFQASYPYITEINKRIRDFNGTLLEQETIRG